VLAEDILNMFAKSYIVYRRRNISSKNFTHFTKANSRELQKISRQSGIIWKVKAQVYCCGTVLFGHCYVAI